MLGHGLDFACRASRYTPKSKKQKEKSHSAHSGVALYWALPLAKRLAREAPNSLFAGRCWSSSRCCRGSRRLTSCWLSGLDLAGSLLAVVLFLLGCGCCLLCRSSLGRRSSLRGGGSLSRSRGLRKRHSSSAQQGSGKNGFQERHGNISLSEEFNGAAFQSEFRMTSQCLGARDR